MRSSSESFSTKLQKSQEFWDKAGFSCTKENEDGSKYYSIDIQDADVKIKEFYHITVK